MTRISAVIDLDVDNGTPVLRPRGTYSDTETYVYDTEFRDAVEVEVMLSGGGKKKYYFVVKEQFTTVKGVKPVVGSTSGPWQESSRFVFITAESITSDMINSDSIFSLQMNVNDKFKVDKNGVMRCVDGMFSGSIYTLPFHITEQNINDVLEFVPGTESVYSPRFDLTGFNIQVDYLPGALWVYLELPRSISYEGAEANILRVTPGNYSAMGVAYIYRSTSGNVIEYGIQSIEQFVNYKLKCIVMDPTGWTVDSDRLVDGKVVEWILLGRNG